MVSSPGYQQGKTVKIFRLIPAAAAAVVLSCLLTSCSGISSAVPSQSTGSSGSHVRIDVTPATATIVSGGQLQFSATLTSTSNTVVFWRATTGTITPRGFYTAPSVTASTIVTVTATSLADGALSATSQITVTPLAKLGIGLRTLPAGTVGTPYSASLSATGGAAPYRWQLSSGVLPKGLSLDPSTGVVAGTASQSGSFSFTTSVTDSNAASASAAVSLAISPSANANYDGPAELPRVYVQSDLANTPAPGNVISVPSGGDFQQALNTAKCGDTIELQSGAVYTGQFKLAVHNCDDDHWIIVRTNAPESSLPPEGTRISPCYGGVASLPARPAFNCPAVKNVLAKVQFGGTGSGPIIWPDGANHYRFVGLEITRTAGTGVVFNLAVREKDGAADHVIFDRCWMHGTAKDETQRAVMLSGTRYTAVVDSYLSDFHCVSRSGACVDSQAIAGGHGDNPMGPFKIVNNFLEAAAENILLGGGAATTTPADIEIRRNHMFKPLIWMAGQHGFVGGHDGNPFIVKNLFELKNAQRVLFEGNILEDSWGGFSQPGYGIEMGAKNQAINDQSVCPLCQVTDITVRYVKISHVGGGLVVASGVSDIGGVALASKRYSIHDVVADDIDGTKYDGFGNFAQVSMGKGAPVLQDVTINHVTAFQPGVMLSIGDDISINQPMNDFVYTNNIAYAGTVPTKTTGGGTANCAYQSTPIILLPKCFQHYTFSNNVIVATPSKFPPSLYPKGNYFPDSVSAVEFVDYRDGAGGDYHLGNRSPYKNAGTDGKDLGADIDAVEDATAGVE